MSAPVFLQAWRDGAICAETDPEVFFPETGETTADAKRVCAGCPVRQPCLDYALEHSATDGRFGVWGGLSERERRRLARTIQRHRRAS